MTNRFPGNTRCTLIIVWIAPAPITPGKVEPGNATAFSEAPVAKMIRPAATVT